MALTPKEAAFCRFVADYQARTGLSPTYREIAEYLRLRALVHFAQSRPKRTRISKTTSTSPITPLGV